MSIGQTRPPTIVEVAGVAGVSPSTASRVLHGGSRVSEALSVRVHGAARDLGYVTNISAQALRGRRDVVALLVDDIGTEAVGQISTAIERSAREAGAVALVSSVGRDRPVQLESLVTMIALRPRALVVSGSWLSSPDSHASIRGELRDFVADGGHVVVIGPVGLLPFPTIAFDDRGAGATVARHVLSHAPRAAVIVAGPAHHPAFRDRSEAMQQVLRDGGVDDIRVYHSVVNRQEADRATEHALARRGADVVLATNDRLATGVLHAVERSGRRAPGDILVTGIDDIAIARDLRPPLTTVALPFQEVGVAALALALDPTGEQHLKPFAGTLVVRRSCPDPS